MKTGMNTSRTITRVFFYSMLVLCLGSSPLAHVWAQETDLSVEQIPADLLEGAGAVIRYSNTRVEVKSPRNMVRSVRKAVTVLNSRGEDEGIAYVYYNKSRKINSLEGSIYDASGKLLRTIRAKDLKDQSAISDFSLFEATRIKFYHPPQLEYPYTIVHEPKIKNPNTHYFSDWFPVSI